MIPRMMFVGLITLLLAVPLSACGGAAKPDPSADEPAAIRPTRISNAEAPAAGALPTPVPTGAAEPTAASAASDEPFALDKLDSGLSGVDSYRLRFTTAVTTSATNDVKTFTYELATITASGDQSVVYLTDDTASGQQPLEMVTVAGTTYMLIGSGADAQCISADMGGGSGSGVISPSDLLGGISDGTLVERNVTIDGIATDHYSIQEPTMIFAAGGFDATADAWVARDGGYLVRYVGTISGDEIANGEAGTLTWTYQLSDVNRVPPIEIPELCAAQSAASNELLPPNADNVTTMGAMTLFTTTDDVDTVSAFYNERLPADGWSAGEPSLVPGMAILSFTKDGRTLNITISADDESTTVMISEE